MTTEILLTLLVLLATIILFVAEIVRVDVVAIIVMIVLPWLGLVDPGEAFSGFASNAVIAIIAIMILDYGIDRSGVMEQITRRIMNLAGSSEKRLVGLVSLTVGGLSSFMQNIGAAALFLPSILRISKRLKLFPSLLLMPMGFAAILGGTLTLFASSPLIMLNDLLAQEGLSSLNVFTVTPLGTVLLGSGVLYFLLLGKFVLPRKEEGAVDRRKDHGEDIEEAWELPENIYECEIPEKSNLIGKTPEGVGIWKEYDLHLLALAKGREFSYAPWRHTKLGKDRKLLLLGKEEDVEKFAEDFGLILSEDSERIRDLKSEEEGGFAEVVIPPRAPLIGKTFRELEFRKVYRIEPIMLLTGEQKEKEDFSDQSLQPGQAIVVFGSWRDLKELDDNENFVVVTPIETEEEKEEKKPVVATLCFTVSIVMAVLGLRLSLSLMTGALAMILLNIVPIREAYEAIDWRTVFLIAGLIPLGIAMDNTGTAVYISEQVLAIFQGSHPIIILTILAALTTSFTLVMSNVAATVLLVPISIAIGQTTGINPTALALLVGVCASNSFILPTHQVNALIMSPGGYRNADYIKAGGILSLIFIAITVPFTYLIFA